MKRNLLIFLVLGVTILIVALVSWVLFPDWRNAQGGIIALGVMAALGVLSAASSIVGLMTDLSNKDENIRLKVPFMVEPLPANYIERSEEHQKAVNALLSLENKKSRNDNSSSLIGLSTALEGAGGYGKTTLARAVCYDRRIRKAFPRGVLWVTLGENITNQALVNKIQDLICSLTGAQAAYTGLDAASFYLRSLLKNWRGILVIDDVWRKADLDPFLQQGASCVCLVTTRNASVLPSNTVKINVDAMRPKEAVSLLRSGLPKGHDEEFRGLAAHLGEWPLLLNIANNVIRNRANLQENLHQSLAFVTKILDDEGITAFDIRNTARRDEAVALTLEKSIDLLESAEREIFYSLAVFPEDVEIPIEAVETLCGCDSEIEKRKIEEFCQFLFTNSLLLICDLGKRIIVMHDVIRQYIINKNSPEKLIELHRNFLEAYRKKCPSGWVSGPNDNYFFRYLIYHLFCAEFEQEYLALLTNYDWLSTYLANSNINGLLADYELILDHGDCAEEITIIRDALQLSSHVLVKDPSQLASQLYDRLMQVQQPKIRSFVHSLTELKKEAWLRSIHPCLRPPGGGEVRTIQNYISEFLSMALIANGRFLITGDKDGNIIVWDFLNGQPVRHIKGHQGPVEAITVLQNEHYAVSCSDDWNIKLWDLSTWQCIATLKGHVGKVLVLEAGNENTFVSAGYDGALRVWSLEKRGPMRTIRSHEGRVLSLKITPDGHYAVSGATDNQIHISDLVRGKTIRVLSGHQAAVSAITLTTGGEKIISGSADGVLIVWDFSTGEKIADFQIEPAEEIECLTLTPDNNWLICGLKSGRILFFDCQKRGEINRLEAHVDKVNALIVPLDSKNLISASSDKTIHVWDLAACLSSHHFEGHSCPVTAVSISSDQRFIVSGAADGIIKIWDISSGQVIKSLMTNKGSVTAVAFTPDGKSVISLNNADKIDFWDLETGKITLSYKGNNCRDLDIVLIEADQYWIFSNHNPNFFSQSFKVWDPVKHKIEYELKDQTFISMSGENQYAVFKSKLTKSINSTQEAQSTAPAAFPGIRIGKTSYFIKALDIRNKKIVFSTEISEDVFYKTVEVTPDYQLAVIREDRRSFSVMELSSREIVQKIKLDADINSFKINLSGKYILFWSDEPVIYVWDIAQQQFHCTLKGHSKAIHTMIFPKGGETAISASDDQSLIMWDLEKGEMIRRFSGFYGRNTAFAFPNGKNTTVSITEEGYINKWNIEFGSVERIQDLTGKVRTNCVAITPDLTNILLRATDHCIFWFNTEAGRYKHIFRYPFSSNISCITVSKIPNFLLIFVGTETGDFEVFRLTDEKLNLFRNLSSEVKQGRVSRLEPDLIFADSMPKYLIQTITISANNHFAILASEDGFIHIYDIVDFTYRGSYKSFDDILAISADFRYAIRGYKKRQIQVWDLKENRLTTQFYCERPILYGAVSRDGKYITACDSRNATYFLELVPQKSTPGQQEPAR